MSQRTVRAAVVPVLVVLALAACAPDRGPSGGADRVAVVASTNVWGDVVSQVGGPLVDVTSIVTDPSADPHSYEANARTQLALSKADLVLANGGGYDDFVDTMVEALDSPPPMLRAVEIAATGEENEHVWYDVPGVAAVADEVARQLAEIDPDNADTYGVNATAFVASLDDLEGKISELHDEVAGRSVAVTEPVPGYLLDALGLVDATPAAFPEAIEEETDVPPAALAATLALFDDDAVDALVYNAQTTGPQTEQVLDAAHAAGIPVVPVTETLPVGRSTYVGWMGDTVEALREALVP